MPDVERVGERPVAFYPKDGIEFNRYFRGVMNLSGIRMTPNYTTPIYSAASMLEPKAAVMHPIHVPEFTPAQRAESDALDRTTRVCG